MTFGACLTTADVERRARIIPIQHPVHYLWIEVSLQGTDVVQLGTEVLVKHHEASRLLRVFVVVANNEVTIHSFQYDSCG